MAANIFGVYIAVQREKQKGSVQMDGTNCTDIYEAHPISEIELLGYAKNNIAEARNMVLCLPYEHWLMLDWAYELLDQVQEYLFTH